jgi:hypothetical protein
MDCRQAPDALAGEDEKAAALAREHMAQCDSCRVLVKALKDYHEAEKDPEPADSRKVRDNVKARMRELKAEEEKYPRGTP